MKMIMAAIAMLMAANPAGAQDALKHLERAARVTELPSVKAASGKPALFVRPASQDFLWKDAEKTFSSGYKPSAVTGTASWRLTGEIVKGAGIGRYDGKGLKEGSVPRRLRVGGLRNPFVPQILKTKAAGLGAWFDREITFDLRMPDESWITSPDHQIRAARCRLVNFDYMLCLVEVDPATGVSVEDAGLRLWGFSRNL